MSKSYNLTVLLVSLTLAAIATTRVAAAAEPMPMSPATFRLDPALSELRLLVRHAGKLGHNHVVVSQNLSGEVHFTGEVTASSFSLTVPVKDFNVDDTQARNEEGSDFPGEQSASDRAGTKKHMLGPKLLDAEHFAQITVKSTAITTTADGFMATMSISIAGHESTLMLPFVLVNAAGQMSATGNVKIRQTALGLKPLSFMLGAITIEDEVTLKFKLVTSAI